MKIVNDVRLSLDVLVVKLDGPTPGINKCRLYRFSPGVLFTTDGASVGSVCRDQIEYWYNRDSDIPSDRQLVRRKCLKIVCYSPDPS